jgi:hypothetical protein
VLDHVQRWRVPEEPARKHLAPAELFGRAAAFLDEDLDERAIFLRLFPGERFLASGDLDHKIADTARLARFHHQVLGKVVALVEDTQRDHAVLVGRADLLPLSGLGRTGLHPGDRVGNAGVLHFGRRLTLAAAGHKREGQKRNGRKRGESDASSERGQLHERRPQASGDQAS